jgi:hypothetical protein
MNLTIERDEAVHELDHVTRHRDAALEFAEERCQVRIQDHINAMEMQNYLNDRIEEGLVEIHCLNNERNPIPHPPPIYLDLGPQVIVAEVLPHLLRWKKMRMRRSSPSAMRMERPSLMLILMMMRRLA